MTRRGLLLLLVPFFALADKSGCPPSFQGKCKCGRVDSYQGISDQYVVNCTNQGFTDTHVLTTLPLETQVLIFTGNHIPELPWNIFGTDGQMEHLRVVDMSNNGIRSILGKTYHRASNVERLVLNYNEISLTENGGHPRLLTGFPNLRELHLTAALAAPEDAALPMQELSALMEILDHGNLTRLVKIHLEQNRIVEPVPSRLFCNLTNVLDLHLGDNWLTGSALTRFSCLKRLRFIDLGRNRIQQLSVQVMNDMDALPKREQPLMIDLGGNPLSCHEFCVGTFSHWLTETKVTVRNLDKLRCVATTPTSCKEVLEAGRADGGHNAASLVLGVLLAGLVVTLGVALYLNRTSLTYQLSPLVDQAGSRKVRYTSIDKPEEQEMNV